MFRSMSVHAPLSPMKWTGVSCVNCANLPSSWTKVLVVWSLIPRSSSDGSYSYSTAFAVSGRGKNSSSAVSFVATNSTSPAVLSTNPAIGIRAINAHNNSATPIPLKTVFFLVFFIPNMSFTSYGLYAKHPTPCSPYRSWGAKCLIFGFDFSYSNGILSDNSLCNWYIPFVKNYNSNKIDLK